MRLASRLREVFIDGRWIANTNYKELLTDVNWEQATRKMMGMNSIAALTFHINYYLDGLLHVFSGGDLLIRDKYSFDMKPIESNEDWKKLVDTFFFFLESFIRHVEQMPESKLAEDFVDKKYGSYLRNIEAVIEHSYYHMGQITLLKKMTTYAGAPHTI